MKTSFLLRCAYRLSINLIRRPDKMDEIGRKFKLQVYYLQWRGNLFALSSTITNLNSLVFLNEDSQSEDPKEQRPCILTPVNPIYTLLSLDSGNLGFARRK